MYIGIKPTNYLFFKTLAPPSSKARSNSYLNLPQMLETFSFNKLLESKICWKFLQEERFLFQFQLKQNREMKKKK